MSKEMRQGDQRSRCEAQLQRVLLLGGIVSLAITLGVLTAMVDGHLADRVMRTASMELHSVNRWLSAELSAS